MFSHERFKRIVALIKRHAEMTIDLMSGIEDNYKNVMLVVMFILEEYLMNVLKIIFIQAEVIQLVSIIFLNDLRGGQNSKF